MPNTPSHNFWDQFIDSLVYTGDRLTDDNGEVPEWGTMTNEQLVDTYELLLEDDLTPPLDLKVEMDSRGLLMFASR